MLALLVALISVLSSAGPVIEVLLTPKSSAIKIAYMGQYTNLIAIRATNEGTRPGIVSAGYFTYDNTHRAGIIRPLDGRYRGGAVIQPGATEIIYYYVDVRTKEDYDGHVAMRLGIAEADYANKRVGTLKCTLEFSETDFAGVTQPVNVERSCGEFASGDPTRDVFAERNISLPVRSAAACIRDALESMDGMSNVEAQLDWEDGHVASVSFAYMPLMDPSSKILIVGDEDGSHESVYFDATEFMVLKLTNARAMLEAKCPPAKGYYSLTPPPSDSK